MVFTINGIEPYKLIRLSANSFTFGPFARKDDPFILTRAAGVAITAVTQAANALITSNAHGLVVGDRATITGIVGMTQLNNWTGRVVSVPNANQYTIDINTTTFTAYASGGSGAKVLTGDYPDCSLYYKGRLFYACTTLKITTVWGSETGNYDIYTLPTVVTDTSALQFTIADIAQRIEWLFPGDNSLIAGSADGIVAINGGEVGSAITAATVEATLTSADGCNHTYPIRKDGLVFYVALNDRNVFYFKYDLLTESFKAQDANIVSYDITKGGFTKLRFKKDRNDLIYAIRGGTDVVTVNFKDLGNELINGWHEHPSFGDIKDVAVITDNNGAPQTFVLALRNGAYFIERQAEYVEFAERVQFFTESDDTEEGRRKAETDDDEAYNRYAAEQLRECIYLDNARTLQDLRGELIYYNGTAASGRILIPAAGTGQFVVGDVGKHIVFKTASGYESGRFLITAFTNSKDVSVDVLQQPKGVGTITIPPGPGAGTYQLGHRGICPSLPSAALGSTPAKR